MIKNKEPNPLNVFGLRRIALPPAHFEYVNVPMKYNLEDSLAKWIVSNLKHRFYIGSNVSLDENNKLIKVVTVGFEETRDMSYFMLACPHLKYN
jgi:hypothetical protein